MTAYSKNIHLLEVWRKHFNEKEVMEKFFKLKSEKLVDIEYEALGKYNFIFKTTKKNIDKIDYLLKSLKKGWWIFKDYACGRVINNKYNSILLSSSMSSSAAKEKKE